MVIGKEELLSKLREFIGDNTSDEAISILEDFTDSLDDYETRLADDTDWKAKYEENDKKWRQKYIDRFNGIVESDADFVEEPKDADETILEYEKPKTYEDLFEVGEE